MTPHLMDFGLLEMGWPQGIEEQNNDDIFDETKDFIEDNVDIDSIDDDDKA